MGTPTLVILNLNCNLCFRLWLMSFQILGPLRSDLSVYQRTSMASVFTQLTAPRILAQSAGGHELNHYNKPNG